MTSGTKAVSSMKYAMLGKTGYKVSRLGFGAMRLPTEGTHVNRELALPMIRKAFESGVNYIDTAVGYCYEDSQRVVGEALKGWRDKIVVSTKNPEYGTDEKRWWKNLENSLERLQVDYIDIYNTHGVTAKSLEEAVRPRIIKWLTKAKDQGLIKHICTSFHDNNDALRKVIDSGFYEVITLQYNILDRQLEDGIAYAHEKNIGVVVMGPIGGGRLGLSNDVLSGILPGIKRIPELALRFVLANQNVTLAISGMTTMQHVVDNIRVWDEDKALSSSDMKIIGEQIERLKRMADLYCPGCGYCRPCPKDIDIPRIFAMYNNARVYGFLEQTKRDYAAWRAKMPEGGMQADSCIDCGQCEEKCPQKIPIRKQLKEAHEALG
jgi:predicted aldo/keto reductase-like oxidoreductase